MSDPNASRVDRLRLCVTGRASRRRVNAVHFKPTQTACLSCCLLSRVLLLQALAAWAGHLHEGHARRNEQGRDVLATQCSNHRLNLERRPGAHIERRHANWRMATKRHWRTNPHSSRICENTFESRNAVCFCTDYSILMLITQYFVQHPSKCLVSARHASGTARICGRMSFLGCINVAILRLAANHSLHMPSPSQADANQPGSSSEHAAMFEPMRSIGLYHSDNEASPKRARTK